MFLHFGNHGIYITIKIMQKFSWQLAVQKN